MSPSVASLDTSPLVVLAGEPGIGKSTAVRTLLTTRYGTVAHKAEGLVRWAEASRPWPALDSPDRLAVLGRYDEPDQPFPGTDRLSMAVGPEATRWALSPSGMLPTLVEGDRLSSLKFIGAVAPARPVRLVILGDGTGSLAASRREDRAVRAGGSRPSESWLRGRRTKLSNLLVGFDVGPQGGKSTWIDQTPAMILPVLPGMGVDEVLEPVLNALLFDPDEWCEYVALTRRSPASVRGER